MESHNNEVELIDAVKRIKFPVTYVDCDMGIFDADDVLLVEVNNLAMGTPEERSFRYADVLGRALAKHINSLRAALQHESSAENN